MSPDTPLQNADVVSASLNSNSNVQKNVEVVAGLTATEVKAVLDYAALHNFPLPKIGAPNRELEITTLYHYIYNRLEEDQEDRMDLKENPRVEADW